MFTDLELNEIENLQNKSSNINELKILLANETTKMIHGKKAAQQAELTAKATFDNKSIGKDLPKIELKKNQLKNGINILNLVLISKISNSKSEIRRMIKNKGIRINNEIINDDKLNINIDSFSDENILKLSHGKKKHVIIKII